jgi:hypothetical protein
MLRHLNSSPSTCDSFEHEAVAGRASCESGREFCGSPSGQRAPPVGTSASLNAQTECHKANSTMAKTQIIVLLIVASVALVRQPGGASCRRLAASPQDLAALATPLSDLNRTSSHSPVQPPRSSHSPPTIKPLEHSASPASPISRRLVVANQTEPHEERNKTSPTPRVAHSSFSTVVGGQQAAGGASLTSVRSKWRQMEQAVASSMAAVSIDLKATLGEIYASLSRHNRQPISQPCKQSLSELVDGLRDQELWASQMLDSSAAARGLPSGLLEGTLTDLGHFDECLAIGQRASDATSGQYCSILVRPALVGRPRLHTVCRRMPSFSPMLSGSNGGGGAGLGNGTLRLLAQQSHQFYYAGLRLGVCVPSSCRQPEVERILQAYLDRFELIGQVKHCQRAAATVNQSGGRQDAGHKHGNTTRTIGSKSATFDQSISENFDLLQQYIL